MENQEIAVISPAEMIKSAVTGGADLDKLEKLLVLQERWEEKEAKKAYNRAMADFKSTNILIKKDKKVGYKTDKGQVGYSHATLFNVVDKITAELSKHGLSASWRTHQNGEISVTCKITHVLGHCEDTTLSAKEDKSGSKNDIQALGSTITYLQRYTLLAATGLATKDQDDDGKATVAIVTDKQLHILRDLMISAELPEAKLLAFLQIEKLENLAAGDYMKALQAIQAAKKVAK